MNNAPEIDSEKIKPVEGRFVWKGPDVDYEKEATRFFSEGDIGEIDNALNHLKRLGNLDFPEITPDTFPLGRFRETLKHVVKTFVRDWVFSCSAVFQWIDTVRMIWAVSSMGWVLILAPLCPNPTGGSCSDM